MRHVVIGTAGHIDHGKSALVRALTGIDPDRLKEEKERGITIDLGFAHYQAGGVNFAFVDVPGHERFIKNMLAGASGIDYVLLVVAADESVMPQTREHFDICRLLQVAGGIVALTKSDLVDPDTIELVKLEARELVAGSFLQAAPIVPVSSKTGEGLDDLRSALASLASSTTPRKATGAVRLPIDRVFSVRGFGTVVTGTLTSGEISLEQDLVVLPADRRVKVRGLQVHGASRDRAAAGQRTAINLGGIDLQDVVRGNTLASPGAFEPTRRFDASLELLPGTKPLKHGARVRFHHGTIELIGRVAIAATGSGPVPSEVTPGGRAHVRLRLEAPAILTREDRFILRAYSPPVTIGGGRVLDPQPPRGGIRTAAARTRFVRLDRVGADWTETLSDAVGVMIEERSATGLPVAALVSRAGVAPHAVAGIVASLVQSGLTTEVGDLLVTPATIVRLEESLLAALREYHEANPLSEGLPREEARERLFGRANPSVFEHVLARLVGADRLVARDRLALANHRVALSDAEERARKAIETTLRTAALKPPDAAALPAMVGIAPAVVDRIVKLLIRQKVLVKIDSLVFHAEALQRLKDEVRKLKEAGKLEKVDVASFKERYDVTRKFAIPLLEYLDRERVTRRVGESRIVI